jgi:hypothetical protein
MNSFHRNSDIAFLRRKRRFTSFALFIAVTGLIITLLLPRQIRACACGCGVFEVGGLSMYPDGPGGMVSLNWDFQNQNHNWSGSSRAAAANNGDKNILTHFLGIDFQYYFNRSWGVQLEIPWDFRTFVTTADNGKLVSLRWSCLGDVRATGWYTGFFKDQSAGIGFGLKFPTGNWNYNDKAGDVDRDSEIGTGTTDILVAAYFHHRITPDDSFHWFAQANLDQPMFARQGYIGGTEIDSVAGIYYNHWYIGKTQVRPIAQIINSWRSCDHGDNSAAPIASGYERIMLSPAVELQYNQMMFDASVDFPVYQYMIGNQLVAHLLLKASVTYRF